MQGSLSGHEKIKAAVFVFYWAVWTNPLTLWCGLFFCGTLYFCGATKSVTSRDQTHLFLKINNQSPLLTLLVNWRCPWITVKIWFAEMETLQPEITQHVGIPHIHQARSLGLHMHTQRHSCNTHMDAQWVNCQQLSLGSPQKSLLKAIGSLMCTWKCSRSEGKLSDHRNKVMWTLYNN